MVAITGCTTGTGYFAALTFAKRGARVIMLNRKSERAETALSKIKEAVPDAKVEHVDCDLTDFASVKKAAAELQSLCSSGLDVLCNNAGVMALADQATADGFDVQMQTNHLSHFLLTREVFPLLEKAAEKSGEVCCSGCWAHASRYRYHSARMLPSEPQDSSLSSVLSASAVASTKAWQILSFSTISHRTRLARCNLAGSSTDSHDPCLCGQARVVNHSSGARKMSSIFGGATPVRLVALVVLPARGLRAM